MKTKRLAKRRLRIEELERRLPLSAGLPPAVEPPRPALGTAGPVQQSTSSNWAGYAVATNLSKPQAGSVTDVKGSWTVPAVTGTSNAWSSFWVGIDGYGSNTVEQIGTESDISSGTAVYYAWYEMYPKYPVMITSVPIKPNDVIQAEVKFQGAGQFSLSIYDVTTHASFTTTQKSPSAKRSSAEWIAEAPWSSGVLPLANFGTVSFTGASATVNGTSGPINSAKWKYDQINMGTSSGLKTQTSSLSASGTSFSVSWLASNAVISKLYAGYQSDKAHDAVLGSAALLKLCTVRPT